MTTDRRASATPAQGVLIADTVLAFIDRKEVLMRLWRKLLPMALLAFVLSTATATAGSPPHYPTRCLQYVGSTCKSVSSYSIAVAAVHRYFKPYDWYSAMKIVKCETGGTYYARARNPKSGALGLFQIIWYWHQWAQKWRLTDPYYNAFVASRLHYNTGHPTWMPWIVGGCYP